MMFESLSSQILFKFSKRKTESCLMQDNAPCHTSAQTRKWLSQKEIKLLTWPPQSPDMNPIESLWDILQRRIKARINRPRNLKDLKEALLQEWDELPSQTLCKLVESLPK